jgi:hypothetical protein
MDTEAAPYCGADPELLATMRALTTSIQTMQVGQRRTGHFLQAVAEQQQQHQQELLHECVTWGSTLRAAQAPVAEADVLLRPRNALGEPIANRAANAFGGGSIPDNIVILDDSDDDNLIWGSPNSGG